MSGPVQVRDRPGGGDGPPAAPGPGALTPVGAAPPALEGASARLAGYIRASGIAGVLAGYGCDRVRTRQLALDRMMLPEPLQDAYRFLLLGGTVPPDRLAPLDGPALAALQAAGLIRIESDGVALDGLRLALHFGCLVVCGAEVAGVTAYHGDDSLALGRQILARAGPGRMLDLCAGPGAQGILAARLGAEVVSVELQPRLAALYQLNAALNGVSARTRLLTGDLTRALPPGPFDLVAANPPLLPVPEGLQLGVIADGGPDGLVVARAIARACAGGLLAPAGTLVLQGVSFGTARGPDLPGVLEPLTGAGLDVLQLSFLAEPLARADGEPAGSFLDAICRTFPGAPGGVAAIRARYRDLADRAGATHLHSWQLVAGPPAGAGGRRVAAAFGWRTRELWLA